MKHIRMAGMAIALSLGTVSVSLAQQPAQGQAAHQHQHQGGRFAKRGGERGMKALLKDIKLTDAQKSQLKQLRQKEQGMRGVRPDSTQLSARQQERFSAIRSILTSDQQKQFDKNVVQLQKKFEERRGQRHKKQGV